MPVARLARLDDLPSLIALFEVSEVSAVAQPRKRAEGIWQRTLAQPGVHVFVSDNQIGSPRLACLSLHQTCCAKEETTDFWRTLSPIPSCGAEVMAKP